VKLNRATAAADQKGFESRDAEILAARAELTRLEDGAFSTLGETLADVVALQVTADGKVMVIRAGAAPTELQSARTRLREAYASRSVAVESLLDRVTNE
jgi:hypothetical protein